MKYVLASLAALAVSVSALELFPGHQYIKRDLAARQTADSSAYNIACATALQSAYVSLPSAPPAVISFIETARIGHRCSVTYPASIESAVSSYASEVKVWYTSHSAEIESALSECTSFSGVGETAFDGDLCPTTLSEGGEGGGTAATTTADDASATEATTTADDASTTDATTTADNASATDATDATTKATTTGGATTTASADTTGTTTAEGSTATNAGNRETGAVAAAAMAVVGVLGVVAAL